MKPTKIIQYFQASLNTFQRNKIRTILTSLGIMIGVFSVVILISLGLGLKNYLKQQFESLGSNLIIIFPGNVFNQEAGPGGGFGPGFAGGANFDEKDYLALKKIPEANFVVPVFFKSSTVEAGREKILGYVQGASEDIFPLLNLKLLTGKLFTKEAVQKKSKEAILGFLLAQKLFSTPEKALGKTVKVSNQRFLITGVLVKKGDREMDNGLVIPYKTTFGTLNPDKTFFTLYLGTKNKANIEIVKRKAKNILLKRYQDDEFSITEQTEILSTANQIFSIINSILIAIGSISLLVGGIGIMNIMYATVTERTKEIGIRRSLGATQKDILTQFLAEAVSLSIFGGLIGLLLAALAVLAVRAFFPASINLLSVILAFTVPTAIGVFFGVFPARKAAKLTPIEAIRYE